MRSDFMIVLVQTADFSQTKEMEEISIREGERIVKISIKHRAIRDC